MRITPFKLFLITCLYSLLFAGCGSNLGLATFLGASSGMNSAGDDVTGGGLGTNFAEDDGEDSESDVTDETATYYIDADGSVVDVIPAGEEIYYEDLEEFASAYAASFATSTDDGVETEDEYGNTEIPVAGAEEYSSDEATEDGSNSAVSGSSATDEGNEEESVDPADAVEEELNGGATDAGSTSGESTTPAESATGEESHADEGSTADVPPTTFDDGSATEESPDDGSASENSGESSESGGNSAEGSTENSADSATDDAWENGTHLKDEMADLPVAGTLPAKNEDEEEGEESNSEGQCSSENTGERTMVMITNDGESTTMMMKSMPGSKLMRKTQLDGLETVARGILLGVAGDDGLESSKTMLKGQTLLFMNQDDLSAAAENDEELAGDPTQCDALPDDIDVGLIPGVKTVADVGSLDGGAGTGDTGAIQHYSWQADSGSLGGMEMVFGKAVLDANGITVIPGTVKDFSGDGGSSVKFSPKDFGLSTDNAEDYQINTMPFIIMRAKSTTVNSETAPVKTGATALKLLSKTGSRL